MFVVTRVVVATTEALMNVLTAVGHVTQLKVRLVFQSCD